MPPDGVIGPPPIPGPGAAWPDQVSKHFSLRELTRTSHRTFLDLNARPPIALLPAARGLCDLLLEPLRLAAAAPIVIHSGYRSPALNRAVGGSWHSQHVKFEAADLHAVGVPLEDLFRIVRTSTWQYGQVILEGWAAGAPSWLHVSLGPPWREAARSGEALTFDGRRYVRVS